MGDAVTISIDPHVHSEGSFDGREPVELILEHVADIGLDGVVITDHDTIEESLRAAELAPEYGLIGIPGVEVSSKHGHVLAIGVEEMPDIRQPVMETVEQIRELGGVAVIPHPFQRMRHGVSKRQIKDCDAIEVYNAWLFTGYRNRRARTFARKRGYPGIGASDAHTIGTIGRAYTELEIDPEKVDTERVSQQPHLIDRDIILNAIKNGSTRIHGARKPIHESAYHYMKGAVRKFGYVTHGGIRQVRRRTPRLRAR